MKKVLLLLLVTSISYGQALNDKGIRITGGITTDNSATKVVVQSSNNVLNTIAKNDLIDVVIVNTTAELTSGIGNTSKLYATRDNTIIYRYNGTIYVPLGGDISSKEDISNKQNSLAADGTNTKYPTVTAVNSALGVVQKDIAYVDANGNNITAVLGNIRNPYLTIDAALDALPNTGGVIKIGVGTFNSPTVSKIKSNVSFIGSGKPYPNMVTTYVDDFTKPTITSPTKLVGGTVLNGKFDLNNKNNIEVRNLGVDAGKLWIDANNGGVALDAFRTSTQNALIPNSSVPPAYGIVVNNVSALCYSAGALIHSILIENTIDAKISNVSTYFGYHGLVIKSKGTNVNNVESYGHAGEGVIVKADTYSYSSDINISNVYISSIGTMDGAGLMIDGGSGNIRNVNISNLNIEFTTYGITATNTSIEDININNVTIFKTQGNGVYFGTSSKNVALNNIKQNWTVSGNGIELISTGTNIKTISNSSTKNCAQYGFYLVGGSGTIQVSNLSSVSDVSGVYLSGNVYGSNVNYTSSLTGTLTLNTGNINAKNIASVIGASNTIGLGSSIYFDNNLSNGAKRFFVPQMNASNGLDFWQFNGTDWVNTGTKINTSGTISAQPATASTEVVVKSQLDSALRPYKVWSALINQTGTSAPTVTVLENTLGGTPTLNYTGVGNYGADLTGAFTSGKTAVIISNGTPLVLSAYRLSNDRVLINCGAGNDRITNATIEIRVYNFMLLLFPYSMIRRRKRKCKSI